jgi:hypothetical protein
MVAAPNRAKLEKPGRGAPGSRLADVAAGGQRGFFIAREGCLARAKERQRRGRWPEEMRR